MTVQVYTENGFILEFLSVDRIVRVTQDYISVKIQGGDTFRRASLDPGIEGKIIEIKLMEDY